MHIKTDNVRVFQGCFWHWIRYDKCRLPWQAFGIYQVDVSGEAHLPSPGSEWSGFLPTYEGCRIERLKFKKELHFIGRAQTVGVSPPKHASHWLFKKHKCHPSVGRDWAPSMIMFKQISGTDLAHLRQKLSDPVKNNDASDFTLTLVQNKISTTMPH